jgi:hypothetical protein
MHSVFLDFANQKNDERSKGDENQKSRICKENIRRKKRKTQLRIRKAKMDRKIKTAYANAPHVHFRCMAGLGLRETNDSGYEMGAFLGTVAGSQGGQGRRGKRLYL